MKSVNEDDPGKLRVGRLFDVLPVDCLTTNKRYQKPLKNIDGSKKQTEKVPFDWFPPNASRCLVTFSCFNIEVFKLACLKFKLNNYIACFI